MVLPDDGTAADGQAIAEDLMNKLKVEKSDLLAGAYMDMIEKKKNKNEV